MSAGLGLALRQALDAHSAWIFGGVLAVCVLLTGALLTTRTARVILRAVRERLSF